jgi:undecaprenyl phosphate N,N'-diacetylbacillosamine 1-phosphate transferase
MYKFFFKRIIDFTIATFGIAVLSPLLFIIALVLTIVNKGNPLFFQARPGKSELIFNVIKFKTMTDARDLNGDLLPDKLRMTKIGSIIRRTSLDEIPQLINVFKGDMSLVGPRPLLTEYLPLYNEIQKKRHKVKPGITGLAQVNGRNAISWIKKFEYDSWYVDNFSFKLDLKIIFLTFKKIIISEGISSEGSVTMEKFNGN